MSHTVYLGVNIISVFGEVENNNVVLYFYVVGGLSANLNLGKMPT